MKVNAENGFALCWFSDSLWHVDFSVLLLHCYCSCIFPLLLKLCACWKDSAKTIQSIICTMLFYYKLNFCNTTDVSCWQDWIVHFLEKQILMIIACFRIVLSLLERRSFLVNYRFSEVINYFYWYSVMANNFQIHHFCQLRFDKQQSCICVSLWTQPNRKIVSLQQ